MGKVDGTRAAIFLAAKTYYRGSSSDTLPEHRGPISGHILPDVIALTRTYTYAGRSRIKYPFSRRRDTARIRDK